MDSSLLTWATMACVGTVFLLRRSRWARVSALGACALYPVLLWQSADNAAAILNVPCWVVSASIGGSAMLAGLLGSLVAVATVREFHRRGQ